MHRAAQGNRLVEKDDEDQSEMHETEQANKLLEKDEEDQDKVYDRLISGINSQTVELLKTELSEDNVNTRERENDGYTPLMYLLWLPPTNNKKAKVELLLEKGADVNVTGKDRVDALHEETPLSIAIHMHDNNTLCLMLEKNRDKNVTCPSRVLGPNQRIPIIQFALEQQNIDAFKMLVNKEYELPQDEYIKEYLKNEALFCLNSQTRFHLQLLDPNYLFNSSEVDYTTKELQEIGLENAKFVLIHLFQGLNISTNNNDNQQLKKIIQFLDKCDKEFTESVLESASKVINSSSLNIPQQREKWKNFCLLMNDLDNLEKERIKQTSDFAMGNHIQGYTSHPRNRMIKSTVGIVVALFICTAASVVYLTKIRSELPETRKFDIIMATALGTIALAATGLFIFILLISRRKGETMENCNPSDPKLMKWTDPETEITWKRTINISNQESVWESPDSMLGTLCLLDRNNLLSEANIEEKTEKKDGEKFTILKDNELSELKKKTKTAQDENKTIALESNRFVILRKQKYEKLLEKAQKCGKDLLKLQNEEKESFIILRNSELEKIEKESRLEDEKYQLLPPSTQTKNPLPVTTNKTALLSIDN